MQDLTLIFGVLAALLHSIAYVLYNIQTKTGQSKPNIATWSIWAFLATLNALSYHKMSGDLVVSLQFFASSVACILTFFLTLVTGRFSRLRPKEWIILALGLFATLIWWLFRSAEGANMIVLVAFVVSFLPTFEGTLRDPSKETSRPWMLWTLAFTVTTINTILRWKGQFVVLLPPIVRLLAHGSIAILSTQKRKDNFAKSEIYECYFIKK